MSPRNTEVKISYEPEADVLMWETSKQPIDYAQEVGNVVVHFNKKNEPVLFEILEARKFLTTAENLMAVKSEDRLPVRSIR
ncbi:MAG: DUF2283 domain-containing protein [Patescibacteria group bacterium]